MFFYCPTLDEVNFVYTKDKNYSEYAHDKISHR